MDHAISVLKRPSVRRACLRSLFVVAIFPPWCCISAQRAMMYLANFLEVLSLLPPITCETVYHIAVRLIVACSHRDAAMPCPHGKSPQMERTRKIRLSLTVLSISNALRVIYLYYVSRMLRVIWLVRYLVSSFLLPSQPADYVCHDVRWFLHQPTYRLSYCALAHSYYNYTVLCCTCVVYCCHYD